MHYRDLKDSENDLIEKAIIAKLHQLRAETARLLSMKDFYLRS